MATVLLVEDEMDLCNLIKEHLEADGYGVVQAFDGLTALTLVERHNPQLIILDWMLPGLDGLAVCRRIRQTHLMPILMLTARSEEIDRVLGLEVGADDYVVKPFSMRELLARVRALLRRVTLDSQSMKSGDQSTVIPEPEQAASAIASADGNPTGALTCGPLRVDPMMHIATLEGSELDLTPKEFELLQLFAEHPGRAFSREFLVERIWGYEYDGFERTVDTHITRLRKKLGPFGEKIVTVWSVGYRLAL